MGLGPQLAVDTAQRAEELGYRSFWTAETTGPEAFSLLAAAGAAAPSLDLGTGVLALQLRTPMVVAMAGGDAPGAPARPRGAARRRHLLPGRHRALARRRPTASARWPGPRVRAPREAVPVGEKVDFAGDFYAVQGLPARGAPRRAPAEGGGRRAQPEDAAPGRRGGRRRAAQLPARPRTSRGRSSRCAGRRRRHRLRLRPRRRVRARATASTRRGATCSPTPSSTPTPRNFERAGYGDEVAEVRERHAAGDREGALAAVSDEMVDAIDVMGDADIVRGHGRGLRRRRRRGAGAHAAAVGPRPAAGRRGHDGAPPAAA